MSPAAVFFAAFLFLGLPALADEIEPEPEPALEPEPQPEPSAAPKAVSAPVPEAATESDGWRIRPSIGWKHGDHRFDLHFDSRFRWERWEALTNNADNIYGIRTRIGGEYFWKDRLGVFAEGQYATVRDLDSNASGAAALYRTNAHRPGRNSVDSFRISKLFAEARLDSENWIRVGRQNLQNASAISYEEENWKYLKNKRLVRRLLGGVEWTHGERAYDGFSARMEQSGNVLHLYVAEPTTGVFEIDRGYTRQKDMIFGGLDWTVERGTWFDNTEVDFFFIGYVDDRDADKVTEPLQPAGSSTRQFFGRIEVYTLGFSTLGVYPVGPGNLDLISWGAVQFGDYVDMMTTGPRNLDQFAGAAIFEAGYQLPDVWAKPWLRTGVNFATGDNNQGDGNRTTFFNILPTNHLYYGYADALAFSNLIDLLVQLKLSPLPKLGVELAFHQFWLFAKNDQRYFGSGAYAKRSLGYSRTPSFGSYNVGQEIDFVVNYQVNKHLSLMAGVAHLFGGGVFSRNPNLPNDGIPDFEDEDVNWAFFQVALSY
jgi:hypothetical protein